MSHIHIAHLAMHNVSSKHNVCVPYSVVDALVELLAHLGPNNSIYVD